MCSAAQDIIDSLIHLSGHSVSEHTVTQTDHCHTVQVLQFLLFLFLVVFFHVSFYKNIPNLNVI